MRIFLLGRAIRVSNDPQIKRNDTNSEAGQKYGLQEIAKLQYGTRLRNTYLRKQYPETQESQESNQNSGIQ
jgi:hypothetical protein